MRARFGDLFTVRAHNGTIVMGCTPAHAQEVFGADPAIFRTFGTEALGPVLGRGSLLVVSGDEHKRQRKLLQPPFHGARMRAYGATMAEVARTHVARLPRGAEVRAHGLTTSITLDVILRTVFGLDGEALARGRAVIGRVLDDFSPLLVFSRHLQHPLFPPWRRFLRAQADFVALLDDVIERRRRDRGHGDDVLGLLLDARWDDDRALTTHEIREMLLTVLVAGHETTSISLAWAIHDLYRDRALVRRVRDEIDALGPTPDPEALAKLPLLGAVCDESLRLRPIVTDVLRTLVEPFEYGGSRLPPGVTVSVAIEAIHADPRVWDEPDRFAPDRFLGRRPGAFEFLPFGGGHRRCLGAAFSDYEARIALATIVSTVDLEPTVVDERVRRNVTMGPKRGVPVRVKGRA
jgi:cytochrome P450